jgi:D-alanyl-D-alanine carboxypeptidase/D-alanyl-D-alanine-endopeptidase (penicillin-binding protein 4)
MKVWFLAALFFSWMVRAEDLNRRLQKVLHSHSIPQSRVGLAVYQLNKTPQHLIFGVNENEDLIPASVTKIVTAATVLQTLGPSYKFQTTLWSSAKIKNGVLQGDLVLKGGGDAGFVSETMWFLVNELVRAKINRIEGHILVDDTDFDRVREDPSRDPERVDRAYDAPVGAMSFNWNSINVYVRPTRGGEPPEVYLDPLPDYYRVENKAKTVDKAGTALEIARDKDRVVVRGTIGAGANEFVAYKNIDDPVDWSGRNLIYFLGQRGITVSGGVKAGQRPAGARLMARADSKPVSQHVADMMKFSNNYVAEMLTKNLALYKGVTPATLDEGMKTVRATLEGMGIGAKRFILLNPSGLSRHNRIKAADLAMVLVQAQHHFPTFAEMLASFPLAGLDGTLKSRMKENGARGWVRAKTGNLSGVVGLAGYAGRKDGSAFAFAFIFNGKAEQGDSARRLFDALAGELVQ